MKEKVLFTRWVRIITFNFAAAITLWPFILIRPGIKPDQRLLNHEKIHLRQQEELLVIVFYLWYVIEYLIRFARHRNHYDAYMNISFEKEARNFERNSDYLKQRKRFNFLKFI